MRRARAHHARRAAPEDERTAHATGLGFATPTLRKQHQLGETLARHLAGLGQMGAPAQVASVFGRSPVEQRPIGLLDQKYAEHGFEVGVPWTLDRAMRLFHAMASDLSTRASEHAMADGGVTPADITDIVFVTSTGMALPGPEVEMIDALGIDPGVNRICVSGMGCSGAFYGWEAARTLAVAKPSAVVLLVCVEACSPHVTTDASRQSLVAHSLFGDAAAAMIVRGDASADGAAAENAVAESAVVEMGPVHSLVAPRYRDLIRWDLGPDGFRITLSPRLPVAVGNEIGAFAAPLIAEASATGEADGVASWSVHPGGSAILDRIDEALGLDPDALASSRRLFAARGNLSSPSVLFALAAERSRHGEGTRGVMLGFGPGLALAGATYSFGPRAVACPF